MGSNRDNTVRGNGKGNSAHGNSMLGRLVIGRSLAADHDGHRLLSHCDDHQAGETQQFHICFRVGAHRHLEGPSRVGESENYGNGSHGRSREHRYHLPEPLVISGRPPETRPRLVRQSPDPDSRRCLRVSLRDRKFAVSPLEGALGQVTRRADG
jgi:hypothetical protein